MNVRKPLEDFLKATVPAYPELPAMLAELTNGTGATYREFHRVATEGHVGTIQFKHRGIIYQLVRLSSIRNTPGFERYKWGIWQELNSETERDDPNVAYRLMVNTFLPWETIRLDT